MSFHKSGPECDGCEKKLAQAHPYMAEWFRRKKKENSLLHVSWSYRGPEDQEKAFKEGKSRLHYPNSKHNHMANNKPCSLALDLFVIDADGLARFPPLLYAKINAENEADHEPIDWAGTWKTFKETCHFQYRGT